MIGPFEGRYEFLSNFSSSPIVVEGKEFPTLEHAFQAAKTLDDSERESVRQAPTPARAKKQGRQVTLRPDWEEAKVKIMGALLKLKFQDRDLCQKLLDTGDEELIELNWWHDCFWGVCIGGRRCSCDHEGKSMLGKLLMALRTKIREAK